MPLQKGSMAVVENIIGNPYGFITDTTSKYYNKTTCKY